MLWLDVELLCHAPFQSFIVMESKGAFSCKLHKRCLGISTIWPPVNEQGLTWEKRTKEDAPKQWILRWSPVGFGYCATFNRDKNPAITGWWFGTWLLWLSIQLGMSSSQLTFTPSFFRGVGSITNQRMFHWARGFPSHVIWTPGDHITRSKDQLDPSLVVDLSIFAADVIHCHIFLCWFTQSILSSCLTHSSSFLTHSSILFSCQWFYVKTCLPQPGRFSISTKHTRTVP
jgi:hypothetical protein